MLTIVEIPSFTVDVKRCWTDKELEEFTLKMNKSKKAQEQMTGREFGEKLLAAVREMKAGKVGRVHHIDVENKNPAIEARKKTGLSQSEFATLTGISVRTLQEWEQGRREPTGAARALLTIASKHPEALLDALSD